MPVLENLLRVLALWGGLPVLLVILAIGLLSLTPPIVELTQHARRKARSTDAASPSEKVA